jgi:ribose transport system ATP-binding protein
MTEDNTILRVSKLCKSFGSTKANIEIDFELKRGEIHGLVGENGSGKSTLLSQVAGILQCDSGEMYLNGALYKPASPLDAYASKIGTVVQEFGVIPALPGAVCVFLGQEKRFMKAGLVSLKKMREAARELGRKWGLNDVPLDGETGFLNVETRKQIELLRALEVDPDILILDEITQALSYDNRNKLYGLIKQFKADGRSVLMISHDLEEIVSIADRLTILRDGKVVDTVSTSEISMNELKRKMVGREMEGSYYRADNAPACGNDVVLSVKDMTVGDEVKDLSFDVHAGEIVGFCGLSDSGIHAIGKAIYGIVPERTGTVSLPGRGIDNIADSQTALRNDMAYVPKERDGEGLMMKSSIRENFCLPSVDNFAKGRIGVLSGRQLNKAAMGGVDDFSVRCKDIFQEAGGLSGGNKQKVNLGRWITKDLAVLILDCPTRGVDVGAKAYIYNLMKELKTKGLGMVLISDELLEVIGMADRILVVKNGEVRKDIPRGPGFTEEEIIEVML